jgi:hypothetical protein
MISSALAVQDPVVVVGSDDQRPGAIQARGTADEVISDQGFDGCNDATMQRPSRGQSVGSCKAPPYLVALSRARCCIGGRDGVGQKVRWPRRQTRNHHAKPSRSKDFVLVELSE